jgi:hypothetical protein
LALVFLRAPPEALCSENGEYSIRKFADRKGKDYYATIEDEAIHGLAAFSPADGSDGGNSFEFDLAYT